MATTSVTIFNFGLAFENRSARTCDKTSRADVVRPSNAFHKGNEKEDR